MGIVFSLFLVTHDNESDRTMQDYNDPSRIMLNVTAAYFKQV